MSTTRIQNQQSPASNPVAAADIQKAQGSQKASESKKAKVDGAQNFDVQISPKAQRRAKEMQKALEIAKETPDIREDKVAQLKAQIDQGTYKVDSGNIADGMLKEAIRDKLSESDEML